MHVTRINPFKNVTKSIPVISVIFLSYQIENKLWNNVILSNKQGNMIVKECFLTKISQCLKNKVNNTLQLGLK